MMRSYHIQYDNTYFLLHLQVFIGDSYRSLCLNFQNYILKKNLKYSNMQTINTLRLAIKQMARTRKMRN